MTWLLEISTDPIWVTVELVLAVLFFRWLLIIRFPLSPRQWKLVEALWISVAFVSVLGLVVEGRMTRAELETERARFEAASALDNIQDWLVAWQPFACEDMAGDDKYDALCKWVTTRHTDMTMILRTDALPTNLAPGLLAGIEGVFQGLDQSDRHIFEERVEAYRGARAEIARLEGLVNGDDRFMPLVPFAPLILTLLVALKLTMIWYDWRRAGSES